MSWLSNLGWLFEWLIKLLLAALIPASAGCAPKWQICTTWEVPVLTQSETASDDTSGADTRTEP
jgi:hypothetical protein